MWVREAGGGGTECGRLWLWRIGETSVVPLGELERDPDQVVVSPSGERAAALYPAFRGRWHGWVARVFSLREGRQVADLTWEGVLHGTGTIDDFAFSDDGRILSLSVEISVQSGSDLKESHLRVLRVVAPRDDSRD